MKRAFRLIIYPRKQILARQGVCVVIVYAVLMPYLMRLLSLNDAMMIAREAFKYSQLLLAFLTVWSVFHFFLPVYQPRVREAVQALHHPVVTCILELTAIQQILCIPVYVWFYVNLPLYRMIIWILIFQSFWLSLACACLLYLFRSPTGIAAVGLIYICIAIPFAESTIPLLLRPGRLLDGFQMNYWMTQGGFLIAMIVFLACYNHVYRRRHFF